MNASRGSSFDGGFPPDGFAIPAVPSHPTGRNTEDPPEPQETASLARRIKRRIWSRRHAFLVMCAPGLESVCAGELRQLGVQVSARLRGGIEFTDSLSTAYAVHLHARCAGRVLLRVAEFRAGAYEELFQRTRKILWETLLHPRCQLEFRVFTNRSRAGHTGKVEETVRAAIRRRWMDQGGEPGRADAGDGGDRSETQGASAFVQRVYVRMEENRCALSMDMTGPSLHFRGYRTEVHRAPLRETMAAGLLLAAGRRPEEPLLDPMCGSGVFPLEAALMDAGKPPGAGREFAFMFWPGFRKAAWAYLVKQACSRIRISGGGRILGRDVDPEALKAAETNARNAGLEGWCAFERMDFFQAPPPFDHGMVVLNPPYGRRLGATLSQERLFDRIGRKLRREYRGWKALVLAPGNEAVQALGLHAEKMLRLDHGGIRVHALYTRIR